MTGQPRVRFLDLGHSEIPEGQLGPYGSTPHPYVVQLGIADGRPYLALSSGSGHLGAGRVFPLHEIVRTSGTVNPHWADQLEQAGATWALPLLRALARGERVTEQEVVEGHRRHHGRDPDVVLLPVPEESG